MGSWILGVVDWGCTGRAQRCLTGLADVQLAQFVSDMYRFGPAEDAKLHAAINKQLGIEIEQALRAMTDAGAPERERIDARSFLRSSGVQWINDYKFGPPMPAA
jgi:hypothetical protein